MININQSFIILLKLTSGNKQLFHNYLLKIQNLFKQNNLVISKQMFPTKYQHFSILRSPHIYKKSIETFETRIYSCQYKILIPTFSKYIQFFFILKFLTKNIPSSINLTIKISNNVKTNL